MTEAREIAENLMRVYGVPAVTSGAAAAVWIGAVWPDWREQISIAMLDRMTCTVLRTSRLKARADAHSLELYTALCAFVADCGGSPPDFLKESFALAEDVLSKIERNS